MVAMRRLTMLAFAVLACIAASPALAVTRSPDGRPRPTGYPDTPTMGYGATPPCYLNSVPVTCEWYGFAHILYPILGAQCLTYTRRVLTNTTLVAPGDLEPYQYYYLGRFVFDTTTNTSYCLYGCFNMGTSGPSPPLGFAPPPATIATPPPALLAPPPAVMTPPPPSTLVSPPPPSTLVSPPPPSTLVSPPPPSASFTSPPAAVSPTPAAAVPPTTAPPPPDSSARVINLNGAGFLRPTGLVSFIISGALLILHGLLGF